MHGNLGYTIVFVLLRAFDSYPNLLIFYALFIDFWLVKFSPTCGVDMVARISAEFGLG